MKDLEVFFYMVTTQETGVEYQLCLIEQEVYVSFVPLCHQLNLDPTGVIEYLDLAEVAVYEYDDPDHSNMLCFLCPIVDMVRYLTTVAVGLYDPDTRLLLLEEFTLGLSSFLTHLINNEEQAPSSN